MSAYYNEIEPYAAQWLRNLIAAGHIAPGDVDERSIVDVQPEDLRGYTQAHFFAGIGVWSHALRSAGWPDDRPVWTGSCPCQPFSAAGKQRGTDDERHLWPEFYRLAAGCCPPIVFGEQVASALGRQWLDAVRADLEALGYAVAAADLCAAGVGAPHIRQRLWWVADANGGQPRQAGAGWLQRSGQHGQQPQDGVVGGLADAQAGGRREQRDALVARESRHADGGGDASGWLAQPAGEGPQRRAEPRQRVAAQLKAAERDGGAGRLADARHCGRATGQPRVDRAPEGRGQENAGPLECSRDMDWLAQPAGEGPQGRAEPWRRANAQRPAAERDGRAGGVADAKSGRHGEHERDAGGVGGARGCGEGEEPKPGRSTQAAGHRGEAGDTGSLHGFWRDADWLLCRDGKWRPVEPGTFPLAHGAPARVGRLRAYGNAIVAPLAAEFISAVMECRP